MIPKNSLTIAAEPRRVIMSLVTVFAAIWEVSIKGLLWNGREFWVRNIKWW
jgi:hypothetical protein